MRGGVAVLTCEIKPPHVKQLISVTGWRRNGEEINTTTGNHFMEFPRGGILHIYQVDDIDSHYQYSCITVNKVTQELKYSDPASIYVIDSVNAEPKITGHIATIEVTAGENIIIPCAATGFPLPTYTYDKDEQELNIKDAESRFSIRFGNLMVTNLQENDTGSYTCRAQNPSGKDEVTINVIVNAPFRISINPPKQIVDSEKQVSLECNIIGFPVDEITWYKDGNLIQIKQQNDEEDEVDNNDDDYDQIGIHNSDNTNIEIYDKRSILTLKNMHKRQQGVYQCFVMNKWNSVQTSAEVTLGDAKPSVQNATPEVMYVKPGVDVSLMCNISGNPLPTVKWLFGDQPVFQSDMFRMSTEVLEEGVVMTYLNISAIDVEHGGLYTCHAKNIIGETWSNTTVHVYGIPFIKEFPNTVTAIAQTNLTLHCHVSGYPVTKINWLRGNNIMPQNHRQRVLANGTLQIVDVNKKDAGNYICDARNTQHQGMQRIAKVTVWDPPVIDPFQMGSKKVGDRVSVSCVVTSGDLPLVISWLKDGDNISSDLGVKMQKTGEFSSLLSISKVNTRHGGNYTCICTNKAAQVNVTSQLIINVPPRWVIQPQDSFVVLNQSTNIDCVAYGIPAPKVTWMKDISGSKSGNYVSIGSDPNEGIMQQENGSLTILKANEPNSAPYLCQAGNGVGEAISKVITVVVHVPAYFPRTRKNYTVTNGHDVQLECEVKGEKPLSVSWRFQSQKINWELNTRLQRSEKAEPDGKKAALTIHKATTSDEGYYVCNTANAFGSDSMLIHLVVQDTPLAPVNVRSGEVAARSATIIWDPVFDGSSVVMTYTITYQPMLGIDEPIVKEVPSPNTNIKLKELYPATMYHVYVTAKNHIGKSDNSEVIAFITKEAAPSGPPQNVQAYAISSTVIQVIWELPEINKRNGKLTGYYINYRRHNSTIPFITVQKMATNGSFDHINIVNLHKFEKYDISVQACNSEGVGPKSTTIQQYTKEDVPAAAPEGLQAVSMTSQSITLVWSPPPLQQLNGILQGYKIFYAPVIGGVVQEDQIAVSNRLNFVLLNLRKFCVYTIKICAFTRVGDGIKSEPALVITKQDVPGVPAGIKALPFEPGVILLTWLPPKELNGDLVKYTIYMTDSSQGDVEYDIDPLEESDLIHNLTTGQKYSFRISASTNAGEGESTQYVYVTPSEKVPAAVVSFPKKFIKPRFSSILLPCISIGDPQPVISWSKMGSGPVFDDGNHVIYHHNGSIEITNVTKDKNEGNYTCKAKNQYGSYEILHILHILVPPESPTIRVISASLTTIIIGWSLTNNNTVDDDSAIKSITVMFKHGHKQWDLYNFPVKDNNHTFTNLKCGTTYFIKAAVHNKVGNSQYSKPLHIKTRGSIPTLPDQSALLRHINSTFIVLNLGVWQSGSCMIQYYDVDIQRWNDRTWSRVEHYISYNVTDYSLSVQSQTWYTLKVTAHNPAGSMNAYIKFSSKSLDGYTIPPPVVYNIDDSSPNSGPYPPMGKNRGSSLNPSVDQGEVFYYYLIIPVTAILVILLVALVWILLHNRHRKLVAYGGAKRLADTRQDNNTAISLLQETTDKELEYTQSHNITGHYSNTPTMQLSAKTLAGDTHKAKPPIIYERRTVLLNSSNESFQSETDIHITPYATFGPANKSKENITADETTPLKCDQTCQDEPSKYSEGTDESHYISPNSKRRNVIEGEKGSTEEETKPLMI